MQLSVGQEIIIKLKGWAPAVVKVTHVTKSGQFKTDATGDDRYVHRYGCEAKKFGTHYGSDKTIKIYPNDPAVLEKLQKEWAAHVEAQNDEDDRKKAAWVERERLYHEQLDTVRRYFPLGEIEKSKIMMPDGSRAYHISMHWTPGTDGLSWIWLMIFCKDGEDIDWDSPTYAKKKVVLSSATYRSTRNAGFPAMGTEHHNTEADAIYSALAFAYFKAY